MKHFKLAAEQIKPVAAGIGGCIATDMITVEGKQVADMYREEPHNPQDSGWRFMSGYESPEYMDEPLNHSVYELSILSAVI